MATERQVQYEFKVIVRVPEWAWPEELRGEIRSHLEEVELWDGSKKVWLDVHSVEQIRDYT